jgi:hypothetical protein
VLTISSSGVLLAKVGVCSGSREVHCWFQRGLLFQFGAMFGSISAHWVPAAFLSRFPDGPLCCFGTYILHLVLVSKVLAFPAQLGEPAFGSVAKLLYLAPLPREVKTCKCFSVYSVAPLVLGSAMLCFSLSQVPKTCLSRALNFHVPSGCGSSMWASALSANYHLESPSVSFFESTLSGICLVS